MNRVAVRLNPGGSTACRVVGCVRQATALAGVDAGVVGEDVVRVAVPAVALIATDALLPSPDHQVADEMLCVAKEVLDAGADQNVLRVDEELAAVVVIDGPRAAVVLRSIATSGTRTLSRLFDLRKSVVLLKRTSADQRLSLKTLN